MIFKFWRDQGLSARPAHSLQDAGVATIFQLRKLGPQGFLRLDNVGKKSEAEVAKVIGWRKPETAPAPTIYEDALERIAAALERIASVLERTEEGEG